MYTTLFHCQIPSTDPLVCLLGRLSIKRVTPVFDAKPDEVILVIRFCDGKLLHELLPTEG